MFDQLPTEMYGLKVIATALAIALPLVATVHIVLTKRNLRAAIGWIGVVWLAPYLGIILYFILGVNRIRRRASRLRPEPIHPRAPRRQPRMPRAVGEAAGLAELVGNMTDLPLLGGNRIVPLINGDDAYPAMLAAIDGAKRSLALSTYIFDNDAVGRRFVDALSAAVKRGVEVRVLVDSVGGRYTFPRIFSALNRADIPMGEFLHSFIPWRMSYLNLRNHRKILVADGELGFTGGINIRRWHVLRDDATAASGIQDLHFKIEGPVVEHLMNVFADDWAFTTGEVLSGDIWFPALKREGEVAARGITGGPDEDYERLRLVMMAAISEAKRSIVIVTPYFLPDDVLMSALNLKAMSGVEVDIIIPRRGNLRLVQWAAMAQLDQLISRGCRVWQTPPPFDHSKLMLVDDTWTFIGSANWDQRSLFLNFEFNLECYGAALAADLATIAEKKRAAAHLLTLQDLEARALPIKLRDGIARLFAPYL